MASNTDVEVQDHASGVRRQHTMEACDSAIPAITGIKASWMVFTSLAMLAREWAYACFAYLYSIDSSKGSFESIVAATGIDDDAYAALTGFGVTATCASFMAVSGVIVFYGASRLHVIVGGLFISASGCLLLSMATDTYCLAYGVVLISIGAGTMYTPTFSLVRGLFMEDGLAATAAGVLFGAKSAGNGFSSLSIVIAETIGWRSTYRLIASALALSIVGVMGMSLYDQDLADSLAKPAAKAAATGNSSGSGGSSRTDDGTATEDLPPTSTTVSTSAARAEGTGDDGQSPRGFSELAAALYSQSSYFLCATLCVSVMSDTPLTIVTWWYPSFIASTYPASDNIYSMYNAALQAVMGATGGITGGRIADIMGREKGGGILQAPGFLQLSAAVGLGGAMFSSTFAASFSWFGLFVFCTTGTSGALYTTIQNVTRSREVDVVLGSFLLVNWWLVAMFADWVGESESLTIRGKLSIMIPVMLAAGGGYFALTPYYEGQRRRAESQGAQGAAAATAEESTSPLLSAGKVS